MNVLKAIIALMLFTLICISSAGASEIQTINPGSAAVAANTGVFAIDSVGNVGVGETASATLYVNNAWNPRFGDTYIDVTWDSSVAEYVSTDIRLSSNTTGTESGAGHVRIALGDFRNGYPTGSYPIATINLKALKAGTTPLTISIDHVRYWSSDLTTFTDITSSARALSGTFSTGALSGAVLDPGYAYEIGSVQSGAWQTYTMDVRSSDDYDILALVYSQANDFDLYISDPLTGAVYTAATAPYSTENGLTYIWAVSTIKPGKYLVSVHSTSGTGNFAFIHFYNRQPTQRAAT